MIRRTPILMLALVVALLAPACRKHKKKVEFGKEPIRASSAEAQQKFDAALADLRERNWTEARDGFRLVQAQYPNDPIATLAEVYGARAMIGDVAVFDDESHPVDSAGLAALARLGEAKSVDPRVRYGALVYYSIGLATSGSHGEATLALAEYPSIEVSPVILEMDELAGQALISEALLGAGRWDDALASYDRLYASTKDAGVREFAKTRAFETALELSDDALVEYSSADGELLRAAAGWTLLDRRARRASDQETEALEALLRRVAADLTAIGEGGRVEALSVSLASRGPAERLAIGVALPLSGAAARAGSRAVNGALVAVDAFSDAQSTTTLVFMDSAKADPDEAIARLRSLGVSAIVGPLDASRAPAWAQAANKAEVPLFALTTEPIGEGAGDWAFRWFIDAESEARATARIAYEEQGDRRVAILRPGIGYGRRMADWFADEIEALGGDVVVDIEYDRGDTDYSRLARRVAAEKPDAIYIPDTAVKVGEVTSFLAQANVWGVDGTRRPDPNARRVQVHYLGTSLWQDPDLLRQARSYVAGALIPAWSSAAYESSDDFFSRYQAATGRGAHDLAAFTYDAVRFVRNGFATGATDTLAIRETARAPTAYRGVTGPTRFGPNGEPIRQLRFITVSDGKFEATERTATVGIPDPS
jgi:ABC-type branched-subunit amino acid transport system substrate-binding protein